MNSVLLYCPMNPVHPRVCDQTLASIMALRWGGRMEIVFGREDTKKAPANRADMHTNLTRKYNTARDMALTGGYDALLTVEADMIVPELALQRMSLIDADVVYGLYVSRHIHHPWLAFQSVTGPGHYTGDLYSKHPEMCLQAWGNVVESKGVGLGCTLIHRRVLEAIPFRCAPDQQVANDWIFALDVDAAGFSQAHDCGVECGHIDGKNIYWPAPDGKYRKETIGDEPKARLEWHTSPQPS